MEIIWFGQSCCTLKDTNVIIVTDPCVTETGLFPSHLEADVVTISHPGFGRAAEGQFRIIDRPGEYEIRDVFITATAIHQMGGETTGEQQSSLIFVFEFEDLVVCHLGGIKMVPSQQQIEGLESIDVLLIPVGGGPSLNAVQASEVISLIEPSIVIPIYYQLPDSLTSLEPLDKFLKEMGQSQRETYPRLRIRRSNLPLETEIVVLDPQLE